VARSINRLLFCSLLVLFLMLGAGLVLRVGGNGYTVLSKVLICIGFSGLVGQITNKLAIRMILDYVYIRLGITRIRVPGSGLLQRNLSQLIDFVSQGSVEILKNEVITKELSEQAVLEKLLETMREELNKEASKNRIVSAMHRALDNEQFYLLLRDRVIKGYARKHRALAIANAAGIIDYDDLLYKVIAASKDMIEKHFEEGVRVVWNELVSQKEKMEEQLSTMVEMALDHFDLAMTVRNRLNQFSPGEIKEKVKEGASDYLGWIEIWGGVLGAMVGLLMGTIV
jgi:uncharacterized membrane protein YheB (UPF0754 family)